MEEANPAQVGSIAAPMLKYVVRLVAVDVQVDSAAVIAYCVIVSHPPEPVDEPLPHADVMHEARSSQTLDRAVLNAAHVVALATAEALIDGQYVVRVDRPVAVEPAALAQVESMLEPYEENELMAVLQVDSSEDDVEHHAAGPEDGVGVGDEAGDGSGGGGGDGEG